MNYLELYCFCKVTRLGWLSQAKCLHGVESWCLTSSSFYPCYPTRMSLRPCPFFDCRLIQSHLIHSFGMSIRSGDTYWLFYFEKVANQLLCLSVTSFQFQHANVRCLDVKFHFHLSFLFWSEFEFFKLVKGKGDNQFNLTFLISSNRLQVVIASSLPSFFCYHRYFQYFPNLANFKKGKLE